MAKQTHDEPSAIFTIGYGHRSLEDFVDILRSHNIQFLGDVRSRPYSRFNPDFSKDVLANKLKPYGVTYVFLGDTLGGDPDAPDVRRQSRQIGETDTSTYVVDYGRVREQPAFKEGMRRLHSAWNQHLRLALMCSESRPEQCHRVRLVGVQLDEDGIPVLHIDENGVLQSQANIMLRVDKGQTTLPGLGMSPRATQSSRTWKPRE